MSTRTIQTLAGYLQTTDTSAHAITDCNFDLATDTIAHVRLRVIAARPTVAEADIFTVEAGFKNDGGTLSQISTDSALTTKQENGAWVVTFGTTGTTFRPSVQNTFGSVTIDWYLVMEVVTFGP